MLLLLGMAYFVRDGKQDVQITQNDPGITNSVAGKTALTAKVVNGQRDGMLNGELPNSHSASESIKNPPPAANNSQRYALTFPEPTSVVEVKAPFRLDEDFTLEAWVSEGDILPTANGEAPPNETILDLSIQMMLNLVHDQRLNKWSFVTATKLIPGYEYVICRGSYTNNNIAIRGERNHIAAIFENGEVRLYVDGKRLDKVNYGPERTPAQAKPPTMVRELLIGNTRMAGQSPFRGLIEGVRYSKGARYNEDFVPPAELTKDSTTEALYLFKEGQGDILKDYSDNGYNGKIIDAKWVKVGRETTISSPPLAVAPFDAQQAKAHQQAWADHLGVPIEYENSIGMKFRLLPPGEFLMGSTADEIKAMEKWVSGNQELEEKLSSEVPQHKVILTNPIYASETEVTQAQYEQVMGTNPSHFSATGKGKDAVAGLDTSNYPVDAVSWRDAADFCTKLSQQEKLKPFYFRSGATFTPLDGIGYRLPTEAEWEYACRGGTTTRFWSGDKDEDLITAGWFSSNSNDHTHAVGKLKANPFGLYDVHGNVREWVQDSWEPSFYEKDEVAVNPSNPFTQKKDQVFRGGNWEVSWFGCRAAGRYSAHPAASSKFGFRVVLPVEAVKESLQQKNVSSTGKVTKGRSDDAPSAAIAPFDSSQAKAHQQAWAKYLGVPVEQEVELPGGEKISFMLIPPGEFMMGSGKQEKDEYLAEAEAAKDTWSIKSIQTEFPQQHIKITKPFYLGKFEVTQAQWKSVMGSNPSKFNKNLQNPVDTVSWDDIDQFLVKSNTVTASQSFSFTLPTQAQWEFACRAGGTTAWHDTESEADLAQVAWHKGNALGQTHPVGQLHPNAFGLYDMHGNVLEWCSDFHLLEVAQTAVKLDPVGPTTGKQRIRRGGHIFAEPRHCRAAYKAWFTPDGRQDFGGFRLAMTIE
ncbi:SUMF1/EgtB/PvdO family nonheme iron enzyme [Gimesia sp.]|uniref:SUMF1/EgtB/PvdO family nonheme iron enzyme n=1 Tax=Gimesia sp. TaxID=2024833 RepID=UPI003A8CA3AD